MLQLLAIIAEAVPAVTTDSSAPLGWATALTGGSATAILGWYAWYTTTKTIPNLVDSFRAEMKAERDQHGEEMRAANDRHAEEMRAANERQVAEKNWHLTAFREELKEERSARKESTSQIVTALASLTDSVKKT